MGTGRAAALCVAVALTGCQTTQVNGVSVTPEEFGQWAGDTVFFADKCGIDTKGIDEKLKAFSWKVAPGGFDHGRVYGYYTTRYAMNAAKLRKMVCPQSGLDGVQRNWNQLLLELR